MTRPASRHVRVIVWIAAAAATISLALAAGYHARGAYRYINVFQEVWGLTQANYVEAVDEKRLLEGAYRGMLGSLDAASSYLDTRELELVSVTPGPAGAGMQVLLSGGVPVVVRVEPGGPAAAAGLHRGDQIWRIDGVPARQTAWPVLDRMLRGGEGKTLELVVLDSRTYKLREATLTLAAPSGPGFDIESRGGRVLVLTLSDPGRVDTAALARELASESARSPQASLLLDLRGHVGVDPAVAARLASVLVPEGPVLQLVSRTEPASVLDTAEGARPAFGGPLFVLVDGGTAGIAEALAAVVRERGSARLCGRRTYGLAGVPELIPLTHGGTILLSTREMRTPSGASWSGDGLEPDKVLALVAGNADAEADRMLEAAVEWVLDGAPEQQRPAA